MRTTLRLFPLVLLLAACGGGDADTDTDTDADTDAVSGDTTPPVITILGDDPLILDEGSTFTDPGATAEDDVDGPVDVTATHDVNPDRHGTYAVTYTATDAAGNTATATREVRVVFRGQLALATVGSDLALVGVAADGSMSLRHRHDLSAERADYSMNHMAFSIAPHPTKPGTVYVTSMNECSTWFGGPGTGCWGNARVDRYTYTANTITHDGLAFLMQRPLRFARPAVSGSTTTLTLRNQSDEPVEITTIAASDLPDDGATLSSECDGVTLAPGATCDVSFTEGTSEIGNLNLELTLPDNTATARFLIRQDTPMIEGVDFDDPLPNLPPCVFGWTDELQAGACAPTAIAISPDGTRAYVNEDNDDEVLVFSIDAAGDFTYLHASGEAYLQGIAVHPDGGILYNGSNVYEITDDGPERIVSGTGGNATEITSTADGDFLVSSINNRRVEIWDLTDDPMAPTLVSELQPSSGRARYQAHTPDLSLIVALDRDAICTMTFDGVELTEADLLAAPLDPSPCADCSYNAVYRSVAVAADGSYAIASAFVNPETEQTYNDLPWMGILSSFTIDPSTRELTAASELTFDGGSRKVLLVDTP